MGSNSKNTKAHPQTMSATPHHHGNSPTAMVTSPKAKTPTLPTNNPSTAASGLPSSPQSVSATPTKAATELSVRKYYPTNPTNPTFAYTYGENDPCVSGVSEVSEGGNTHPIRCMCDECVPM